MEEGSLRCDVNTSLAPRGSAGWGTRTETKNVNSLRSVERAVRSEIERQAAVLDAGGRVVQETRHFHEDSGRPRRAGARKKRRTTGTSRSPTWCRSRRRAMGAAAAGDPARAAVGPPGAGCRPSGRCPRRTSTALGNAGALDLVAETVAAGATPADARKWWLGELSRHANDSGTELAVLPVTPAEVATIAGLVASGALTDQLARQVLDGVLAGEGDPDEIVAARGLAVVSDDATLLTAVDAAIAARPDVAAKIRAGKAPAADALVGAVMNATKGQADAARARELILQRLAQS